jgi:hypothetical protein
VSALLRTTVPTSAFGYKMSGELLGHQLLLTQTVAPPSTLSPTRSIVGLGAMAADVTVEVGAGAALQDPHRPNAHRLLRRGEIGGDRLINTGVLQFQRRL